MEHLPKTLKAVAEKAQELVKVKDNGTFVRGTIAAVKRALPELRLARSTIVKCYQQPEEIVARSAKQSRLGSSKGCRVRGGGLKLECANVVFSVGQWHEEIAAKCLWVTDIELFLEFEERLKQYISILQTLEEESGLTTVQATELKQMSSRVNQFKDANCRRI